MNRIHRLSIIWTYSFYMLLAAVPVLAASIVISKYLFGDRISMAYAIPVILAMSGGYYLARNQRYTRIHTGTDPWLFARFIAGGCLLTAALNIIHMEWFLGTNLSIASFVMPLLAGAIFGYLLAKNALLNDKLLDMATLDPVTRIYNRTQFENLVNEEIDRVNRYGGKFSLIQFKLDDFEKIYNHHGREESDRMLSIVAKVVRENNRSPDVFSRIEADSFAVLDTQNDLQGAYNHTQRLMNAIDYLNIENIGRISCSFGVTEYLMGKDDVKSLMTAAAEAVIRAQEQGKHCIELNDRKKGSPYIKRAQPSLNKDTDKV